MLSNETDLDTPVAEWRGYEINHQPVKGGLVVTEAESDQAANVEWVDLLTGMWDAIGKPLDEKRLHKYVKELSWIPMGLLERAVSRAIRTSGDYLVVPTIAAIWNAVRKELKNPLDLDEAIERWCETQYQAAVRRFE